MSCPHGLLLLSASSHITRCSPLPCLMPFCRHLIDLGLLSFHLQNRQVLQIHFYTQYEYFSLSTHRTTYQTSSLGYQHAFFHPLPTLKTPCLGCSPGFSQLDPDSTFHHQAPF